MTVILYTKEHCVQCTATARWLTNAGVEFEARPLVNPDNLDLVKSLGYSSAPVVVITNESDEILDSWSGFNPPKLTEHLS